MNRVERLLGTVDELHGRRIRCFGEGIYLQTFPEQLGREVRFAVDKESSQDDPVHPAGRLCREVALWDLSLVIWRQNQVLAVLPPEGEGAVVTYC